MRNRMRCGVWIVALVVFGAMAACGHSDKTIESSEGGWQQEFPVDKANLKSSGAARYFILRPGYRLTYGEGRETLTVTVLDETKVVDGVETRVVEEREMKDGKLAEVSRNYFAIDKGAGDVYYFGEDVDIYKDGKVVGHEGVWLSGARGAKFGMLMPGKPKVGQRYYQEQAPGVAMDRAEIVGVNETLETPAGEFKECVKTKETSAVERGTEYKWYAPGVGLIKDGELLLVKVEEGGR